jgi:hypothetical protein
MNSRYMEVLIDHFEVINCNTGKVYEQLLSREDADEYLCVMRENNPGSRFKMVAVLDA